MNRAIEEDDLTQSIALYISKHGYTIANQVDDWIERSADYVRISEPVTVKFDPLADEEVLQGRVRSIDAQIEETRAELTRRIAELTDQKNRLLAITHQSEAD